MANAQQYFVPDGFFPNERSRPLREVRVIRIEGSYTVFRYCDTGEKGRTPSKQLILRDPDGSREFWTVYYTRPGARPERTGKFFALDAAIRAFEADRDGIPSVPGDSVQLLNQYGTILRMAESSTDESEHRENTVFPI